MRVLHSTLANGLKLYRISLVGGPADGSQALAVGSRTMVRSGSQVHVYERRREGGYHFIRSERH